MALLLRSFGAVGGKDEPPAAQAFKLTHLSHAHHVLTLRSALVDRVAQDGVLGPILHCTSGFRGVLRCLYMAWVCMCSEERNVECTGGLWRPEIGVLAHLASV